MTISIKHHILKHHILELPKNTQDLAGTKLPNKIKKKLENLTSPVNKFDDLPLSKGTSSLKNNNQLVQHPNVQILHEFDTKRVQATSRLSFCCARLCLTLAQPRPYAEGR